MRKNWKSYSITERIYGTRIVRRYIVAPSGNLYLMWTNTKAAMWDIHQEKNFIENLKYSLGLPNSFDYHMHPTTIDTNDGKKAYQGIINKIYEIEENGGYPHQTKINKLISKIEEFKWALSNGNGSYQSW